MDYTQSDAYVTHMGTGHRMHQDTAPITTEVSAADMNMVVWSLMEVLNAASVAGASFDASNPATYTKLITALRSLFAKADEHVSITSFGAAPGNTATANTAAVNGAIAFASLLGRSIFVPGCVGEYQVNDEFTLPDRMWAVGEGKSSTITQMMPGKNIFILGNDSGVSRLHLKFGVAGNNLDLTKQNAVFGSGKKNVRVLGNWLELVDIHCGVQLRDCPGVLIHGNLIWGAVWPTGTGPGANSADILLYSGTAGGKASITSNWCLSNSSQGIYANALGLDADINVSGNFCITMLPDLSAETPAVSVVRRHGIITSYAGSNQTRQSVIGNFCGNTAWSGIYVQGSGTITAGQVLVHANVCLNNGWELGNALSGGIFVTSSGGEVITGNSIINFRNTLVGVGGVTVVCPVAGGSSGTLVDSNIISGSLVAGISIGTHSRDVVVTNNQIINSVSNDVYVGLTGGDAGIGGIKIEHNTMVRTNAATQSISITQQAGTKRSFVRHNTIRGIDNTTNSGNNSGVYVVGVAPPVTVTDNYVDTFYYGVCFPSYFPTATRDITKTVVDRNHLANCAQGIGGSSTGNSAVVPVQDNIFENCTSDIGAGPGAGSTALYVARRVGKKLEVPVTAVPTVGTWVLGDRFPNQAGTVGQPKAWQCTTAGSTGTFVLTSEGNL